METLLETAMIGFYADLMEKTFTAESPEEMNDSIEGVIKNKLEGIDWEELGAYIMKTHKTIVESLLQEAYHQGVLPDTTPENAEAIVFSSRLYSTAMETASIYMFQLGWRAKEAVMEASDEG